MKKYDVYAIGNALVDYEFEVTHDKLKELKVEKGLMTLVDQERQQQLLQNLGEEGKHSRACGGSAANTIIGVGQFGGAAFYSCKVANDETGDFYCRDLLSNGVDSNVGENRDEGTTGKCLVMVTPDAERTMNTYLGITANFSATELDENALKDAKYLYIEGYLVASPSAKEACIQARTLAREHDVKVALTFSDPNMVEFFGEGLLEIMGGKVDLLFCNEQEALTFTKTATVAEAIEALKQHAETFAITLGSKGAVVYDGTTLHEIEPHKVTAVDTNGAGDMFAGAFMYAITKGQDFSTAAKLASLASAKLVSKFGPRLEKEQALSVLEEFGV